MADTVDKIHNNSVFCLEVSTGFKIWSKNQILIISIYLSDKNEANDRKSDKFDVVNAHSQIHIHANLQIKYPRSDHSLGKRYPYPQLL